MKAALLLSFVASALTTPINLNPLSNDIQPTGNPNATQITFLPTYANQTADGNWNVRLYGFAYNSTTQQNNTFSDYLSDTTIKALQHAANGDEEKANLTRNLQPFLYANYLSGINITVSLDNQTVTTPQPTNFTGVFNEFVGVPNVTQPAGSVVDFSAVSPAAVNSTGNVTLVPQTGYSVIADIDDVLRITEIWHPITGLENTFLRPYVPVPNMPQVFSQWNNTLPNSTFHYGTTTPIPLASTYIQWLNWNYPYGSLDMRPMDISHPDEILDARQKQLTELVETFPNRQFIMIGDTSSSTLLKAYPNFARQYPNNTACIFLRNITASYPNFENPMMNLQKSFDGVPPEKWFVFDNATSLLNVNIPNGNCHPNGIPPTQTTESGGF